MHRPSSGDKLAELDWRRPTLPGGTTITFSQHNTNPHRVGKFNLSKLWLASENSLLEHRILFVVRFVCRLEQVYANVLCITYAFVANVDYRLAGDRIRGSPTADRCAIYETAGDRPVEIERCVRDDFLVH